MIYVIVIKHAKLPYSLIEFQLLPCAPVCGYKFHTLTVHLHSKFTVPFQSEAHLESSRTSAMELFLQKESMPLDCWLFSQKSSIVDVWQDSKRNSHYSSQKV